MGDFRYLLSRPPVMPITRTGPFTCEICKRPGWGADNARVHQGKCRIQLTRQNAVKSLARRKARQVAQVARVA